VRSAEIISRGRVTAVVTGGDWRPGYFVIEDPQYGFVATPPLMMTAVRMRGKPVDSDEFASNGIRKIHPGRWSATVRGGLMAIEIDPTEIQSDAFGGTILGPVSQTGVNPGIIIEAKGSREPKFVFPTAGAGIVVDGETANGPETMEAIQRGEFNGQQVTTCTWPLRHPDGSWDAALGSFVGIGPESVSFCPLGPIGPGLPGPEQLFPIKTTVDVQLPTDISANPTLILSFIRR
jgi:hypothetical protein